MYDSLKEMEEGEEAEEEEEKEGNGEPGVMYHQEEARDELVVDADDKSCEEPSETS